MYKFPLKNPSPDFESFKKVLKGEKKPERVYFVEMWVDEEIRKFITENLIGDKWVPAPPEYSLLTSGDLVPSITSLEDKKAYWRQNINFFYRMGYDCLPDMDAATLYFQSLVRKTRIANDTAYLSKGKRVWAEEGKGMISSWEDFEKFPWEKMEKINLYLEDYYDFLDKNLPEGMKISVSFSLYEQVLEWILGYEGLFYLLYDQPDLVKAIFNRWGKIVYDFYRSIVPLKIVGAIWHGDDLGYKTGTMLSPEILRELVFPWFKKYSTLAHEYEKMYWYHCCGNVLEIMEDLIEDVKIDAFHSFQDVIIPVGEFKKRYGEKIATLGGVDVDKLCRLDEENLRKYVRKILEECMPGGRYALGAGNSITNYVPIKNYLIMLDEGLNWRQ